MCCHRSWRGLVALGALDRFNGSRQVGGVGVLGAAGNKFESGKEDDGFDDHRATEENGRFGEQSAGAGLGSGGAAAAGAASAFARGFLSPGAAASGFFSFSAMILRVLFFSPITAREPGPLPFYLIGSKRDCALRSISR